MRAAVVVLAGAASLGLAASAGCLSGPSDPCSKANDHIAECTGIDSAASTGTCNGQRARLLSGMDCDDLNELARVGKADGWWDSLLCDLNFTDHCAPGARSDLRTVVGEVHKLDDTPAVAVYVRLLPETTSEPMRGSWTFVDGVFVFDKVAEARYRIEVAVSPTGGTLTAAEIEGLDAVIVRAPVP
jgi:hypothetical protein